MKKWDASSDTAPPKRTRRGTPAVDTEHRREFVDRIQRRARELQQRAVDAKREPAGDQEPGTEG